jgi:hypothetical protein
LEGKGRQFGLKSRKRSEIADQTTEYYTPNETWSNDMISQKVFIQK